MPPSKPPSKRKRYIVFFTVLLFTMVLGVTGQFTSADLDALCNQDGSVLYRYSGNWLCGVLPQPQVYTGGTLIFNGTLNGTTGFLALWKNGTSLNDSNIFQGGGMVGVNTSQPNFTLHIVGNVSIGYSQLNLSSSGITYPDGTFQNTSPNVSGFAPSNGHYLTTLPDPILTEEIVIPETFFLTEDFTGSIVIGARFSTLGVATVSTADEGIIGAYNLFTGTGFGSDGALSFGATTDTTLGLYNITNITRIGSRFKLLDTIDQNTLWGVIRTSVNQNSTTPQQGVYFLLNTSSNNALHWTAVTCDGANGCTFGNTSIPADTAWNTYRILIFNTTTQPNWAEFYLNNVLVFNTTSNIPTTGKGAWMGFWTETLNPLTNKNMRVDYMHLESLR